MVMAFPFGEVALRPAPTGSFSRTCSSSGEEGIVLAGSGTAHADGSPELSYQWRIADASHSELVMNLTDFLNDADQALAGFTMPRRRDVYHRSALDDGNWIDFELTVTDGDGAAASDTMRLTIQGTTWAANTPPTVAELAAARVFTGETVSLAGQAGDFEDTADALSFLWEQTGGTPAVSIDGASSATASFTAPVVSTIAALTFRLSVTDSGGLTASRETTVTVLPLPTACAGDDLTGTPGAEATLQGICSTNPYGEWWRMQHQWEQLSGPEVTLTHPEVERYNQEADKFGDPRFIVPTDAAEGTTLEFELTVTDQEGGTSTDTVTVTVTSESGTSG